MCAVAGGGGEAGFEGGCVGSWVEGVAIEGGEFAEVEGERDGFADCDGAVGWGREVSWEVSLAATRECTRLGIEDENRGMETGHTVSQAFQFLWALFLRYYLIEIL